MPETSYYMSHPDQQLRGCYVQHISEELDKDKAVPVVWFSSCPTVYVRTWWVPGSTKRGWVAVNPYQTGLLHCFLPHRKVSRVYSEG